MSEANAVKTKAVGNKAVENPQSLTPEELLQVVQDLASRAPIVDPPAETNSSGMRRKLAAIDPELVTASLSALHATEEIQAALGRSDADVTADSTEAMTWSVAIDAVRKLVDGLAEANGYRVERVGLTALQTYYICKQLAKARKHGKALAPHIAEMKRIIARGRKRKTTPATPEPDPSPAPTPAPQQQAG